MIEIVMSVCSILHGAQCKTERLTYMAQSATPHQCMVCDQAEIAKWIGEHPNWIVRKWSCGQRREVAKA